VTVNLDLKVMVQYLGLYIVLVVYAMRG